MSESPVSTHVLATRGREIWLVAVDVGGPPPRLLLKHHSAVRFAAISPDASRLVFSSEGSGKWRIWVASRKPDATNEPDRADDGLYIEPRPITAVTGYGPSISHDGKLVYFESGSGGLWRIRLDGTGATDPFLAKEYPKAHTVYCSRDGRFVAFSQDRAIYLHELATGTTKRLTDGKSYDRFPSILGEEITFYRQDSPSDNQAAPVAKLMGMKLDGSGARPLFGGEPLLGVFLGPTP